jgi:hypothetical protein
MASPMREFVPEFAIARGGNAHERGLSGTVPRSDERISLTSKDLNWWRRRESVCHDPQILE